MFVLPGPKVGIVYILGFLWFDVEDIYILEHQARRHLGSTFCDIRHGSRVVLLPCFLILFATADSSQKSQTMSLQIAQSRSYVHISGPKVGIIFTYLEPYRNSAAYGSFLPCCLRCWSWTPSAWTFGNRKETQGPNAELLLLFFQ